MCYDTTQLKLRILKEGLQNTDNLEEEIRIMREIDRLEQEQIQEPKYLASGFAHPELLVITSVNPHVEGELMQWGLIPHWVKNNETASQIHNKTINARGETIFEKPSFRSSAKHKRCVIPVNNFFEHYHLNNQTYPFLVKLKDDEPMFLAGLWDEWVDKKTGEIIKSFTIVTCKANQLLAKIHNNPKAKEPRMPVVLNLSKISSWLNLDNSLKDLILPYDDAQMEAYPVHKIRGKNGTGNSPKALVKVEYPELALVGF